MKKLIYLVSVTREGVKRTSQMVESEARYTVLDAVRLGHSVSCRPMADGDPIILGVRTERVE